MTSRCCWFIHPEIESGAIGMGQSGAHQIRIQPTAVSGPSKRLDPKEIQNWTLRAVSRRFVLGVEQCSLDSVPQYDVDQYEIRLVEIPVGGLKCRAAGKQSVGMEILDRKCAPAYNRPSGRSE